MADYTALVAKWPDISGATIADKLAVINALTIAGPKRDIPIGEVVGYLALQAKLAPLQAYPTAGTGNAQAVAAAKSFAALIAIPQVSVFQTSLEAVYTGFQGFLTALTADEASGITSDDATAIIALADTTELWITANNYAEIGEGDLKAAELI